jgi:hypothetical protein
MKVWVKFELKFYPLERASNCQFSNYGRLREQQQTNFENIGTNVCFFMVKKAHFLALYPKMGLLFKLKSILK